MDVLDAFRALIAYKPFGFPPLAKPPGKVYTELAIDLRSDSKDDFLRRLAAPSQIEEIIDEVPGVTDCERLGWRCRRATPGGCDVCSLLALSRWKSSNSVVGGEKETMAQKKTIR